MASWAEARVLIVDDEPDIVEVMAAELEALGCREVLVASDGTSGLCRFNERRVNLVISDIRMPRSDGVELLKNIKRARPDFTGVYLMTGYSDVKVDELLRLGAVAVFKKPFDLREMVRALESGLGIGSR